MLPAVEFQSVSFSYENTNVVENATFVIQAGDFVSIIGPNGGGKTTLLKLMLGILKPNHGSIRLFDRSPRLSCSKVGYTPQFLSVDFSFPLSVLDVVLMGRIRAGFSPAQLWYSKEDRNAVRYSLQILQLEEFAETPFRNLSGGQRQRVLIARALCGQPEILLLDEPTNNIDAASEQILFHTLTELNKMMTIVMVSHDIGFVSQCVKNVICVNRTVAVHSASAMNGKTIHDLYGQHGMKLVLHDHY